MDYVNCITVGKTTLEKIRKPQTIEHQKGHGVGDDSLIPKLVPVPVEKPQIVFEEQGPVPKKRRISHASNQRVANTNTFPNPMPVETPQIVSASVIADEKASPEWKKATKSDVEKAAKFKISFQEYKKRAEERARHEEMVKKRRELMLKPNYRDNVSVTPPPPDYNALRNVANMRVVQKKEESIGKQPIHLHIVDKPLVQDDVRLKNDISQPATLKDHSSRGDAGAPPPAKKRKVSNATAASRAKPRRLLYPEIMTKENKDSLSELEEERWPVYMSDVYEVGLEIDYSFYWYDFPCHKD